MDILQYIPLDLCETIHRIYFKTYIFPLLKSYVDNNKTIEYKLKHIFEDNPITNIINQYDYKTKQRSGSNILQNYTKINKVAQNIQQLSQAMYNN